MSKLDKATSVAVIVVSLALVADVAGRHLSKSNRPDQSSTAIAKAVQAQYQPGEIFHAPQHLSLTAGRKTLLLIAKEGCRFCAASVPFYQKLLAAVSSGGSKVDVVGVCPDTESACSEYFQQQAVPVHRVAGVGRNELSELRVPGTPTLIFVNEKSVVDSVWLGQLSAAKENEVMRSVAKGSSN
jgi:hypothetical protein